VPSEHHSGKAQPSPSLPRHAPFAVDAVLDAPYAGIEQQAVELAGAGFDGAFTLESNRDVLFPLVLAARSGADLQLYPNVAIAFPRSPMHLAYQAWDLQQLTGGRFALGLGSQFRGDYYTFTLMTPTFIPPALEWGPPPIWMGALGPQMTRAASEVADGVLIHPFNTERFLREQTLPRVEAGLAASGRTRADFGVTVTTIVCVYGTEEEREAAERSCRFNLAFYGSTPSYRVTLDVHGWEGLQPELNRLSKEGRWAEMGALVDDEVLHTICVCGSPAEVAAQLRARFTGVADRVAFSVPYGVRRVLLAEVLENLRA
jgi:alkanesulfonate monooxygenase SsuD/methylene tetrahydromethanopterin reductase-like flavin-dependent oxidoreductase (luciferase family)